MHFCPISLLSSIVASLCFIHTEYLTQVDLEEERETQEMNAKQEFDEGKGKGKGTTMPQLLEKLSRPGQIPLFYCGGLGILLQAVTDCECSSGSRFTQLPFFSDLLVPLFPQ